MKLNEIPLNTIVELNFDYMDERFTVSAAVLYIYMDTVYVSAVKCAGVTVSAKKLSNFSLSFKTEACSLFFDNLTPRSASYYGQNLYAIQSQQEAKLLMNDITFRLFIGTPVSAKIITGDNTKHVECILKNISMIGMDIICNMKLDEMSKIQISFCVNNNSKEILNGNIIHIQKFKNNDCYLYSCEFDEPNVIIGSYVAKRQAELSLEKE